MKIKGGHRPPLPPDKVAAIKRLAVDKKLSQRAIGRMIGVSYTTVKKYSRHRQTEQPKY